MRFIVDISPEIVDQIRKYIQSGEYRTIQDFLLTSMHNQIYLLENPESYASTNIENIEPPEIPLLDEENKLKTFSKTKHDDEIQLMDANQNITSDTLSGFWNKFFPIKITLRVLHRILSRRDGPVLLDALHETASKEARSIGLMLVKAEKGSGRKRGDRLSTGLPIKKNREKSLARFKSHFVGTLGRNRINGMPGTLRMISIRKGDDGRDYVFMTKQGLDFSNLMNPILDKKDYSQTLSNIEQRFLINLIQKELPQEYSEIIAIVSLINEGKDNTKDLLSHLIPIKPNTSKTKLTTFLSGILNRIVDLNLVLRRYENLYYIYGVSEKGKRMIEEVK